MRVVALVAIGWTVVVALVLIGTPRLTSGSPCVDMLQPLPGCDVLENAGNHLVWVTQTQPMLTLAVAGYVAIGILGFAIRRRR